MPGNALPPRKRFRPVDTIAGIAGHFERTDGGYLYREDGHGPAIFVTPPERDAFLRAGGRTTLYHIVALLLAGAAAWLTVTRLLPDSSDLARSVTTAMIASLAAILLIISHDHARRAPARALAGRPIAAPARDPDFAKRYDYGVIAGMIAVTWLWAATGSGDIAYRAFCALCTTLVGGFVILRRIRAYRRLHPDQQARAVAERADEARFQKARAQRAPKVNGCGLLLFFLLEGAAALVMLFGTIAIVLNVAGEPATAPDGWIFAGAFILGLVLAYLAMSLLDRLCRRWTGGSAMESFNWLPVNW